MMPSAGDDGALAQPARILDLRQRGGPVGGGDMAADASNALPEDPGYTLTTGIRPAAIRNG